MAADPDPVGTQLLVSAAHELLDKARNLGWVSSPTPKPPQGPPPGYVMPANWVYEREGEDDSIKTKRQRTCESLMAKYDMAPVMSANFNHMKLDNRGTTSGACQLIFIMPRFSYLFHRRFGNMGRSYFVTPSPKQKMKKGRAERWWLSTVFVS